MKWCEKYFDVLRGKSQHPRRISDLACNLCREAFNVHSTSFPVDHKKPILSLTHQKKSSSLEIRGASTNTFTYDV